MSATPPQPEPRPAPFVGPRPFEGAEERLFFGREAEVGELLSFVVANPVVLLHAPSGAGKSSLLNAGLIPALEREAGFEVLPPARVRRAVAEGGASASSGTNVFVGNALAHWQAAAQAAAGDAPARSGGGPRRAAEHGEDPTFGEYLERLERRTDRRGRPLPRVLVFDQFEEIVLVHPERWEQRAGFFEQLAEALERDTRLRVVLALREDYLAALDPYLPILPDAWRFRLERLSPEAALEAARGPIAAEGLSFAPGVAERLVGELRRSRQHLGGSEAVEFEGEFVEPVQLQLVGDSLWRELPAGVDVITDDHVREFGDVDQVLTRFYTDAVRAAAVAGGVDEGELRDWVGEHFITYMGTRGTVVGTPYSTAGMPNAVVDVLEQRRLIRREWRAGAGWYELSHDRFIGPIRAANESWLRAAAGGLGDHSAERSANQALARAQDAEADGRFDDAQLSLQEASRLFADLGDRAGSAFTTLRMSAVALDVGDVDGALQSAIEATETYEELDDAGGMAAARAQIAETRLETGAFGEAIDAAREAIALAQRADDPEAVLQLLHRWVGVMLDGFLADEAVELCESTLERYVASRHFFGVAAVGRFLGDLIRSEDLGEPVRHYREAADSYLDAGDPVAAAQTLLRLADWHEQAEDYDAQIAVCDEAIALVPDDAAPVLRRAFAHWYAGHWPDAIADFTHVLERAPKHLDALNGRAHARAESGHFADALADADEVVARAHGPIVAYAHNARGLALGGLGRYEEALRAFETSLSREPGNAWALFNRAVTHERAGQRRKARADFRRALTASAPALNPWRRRVADAAVGGT